MVKSFSHIFKRVLCVYPHGQASCRSTRGSLWVPEELPIKCPWCEFIGSKFSHLLVAWKYLYFTCISRRYFCWEWNFGSAGGLGVTLLASAFWRCCSIVPSESWMGTVSFKGMCPFLSCVRFILVLNLFDSDVRFVVLLKNSWFSVSFRCTSKVIQLYVCMCVCIYINISILFQILFHYSLLQDTEYSCLCYTVGPCYLFHISHCVSVNTKFLTYFFISLHPLWWT